MMILVTGPSGSGKSAAAEARAESLHARSSGNLLYVATMVPANDDGRRRIAAHRQFRSGKGFITLESPLADLDSTHAGFVETDDVMLLEDLSNLLANLMFAVHEPHPADIAWRRVRRLRDSCRHLIVVTIGGLTPEPEHDADTVAYIAALNRLNATLAEAANQVITMAPRSSVESLP